MSYDIYGDRQIKLAKRLADYSGAHFVVSGPLQERVNRVLGEYP